MNSEAFAPQRSMFIGEVKSEDIIVKSTGEPSIVTTDKTPVESFIIMKMPASNQELIGIENKEGIKELMLPPQIKSIADQALEGMINLEKIDVSNVETFGEEALAGAGRDTGDKNIQLKKAKNINNFAFAEVNANIYLNDDVENVSELAFADAKHLYYNGNLEGAPWGAQALN